MQTLICIAEEHNLTAAGRRLLLTQQAVSAQVKKLEALTGRRLVYRTPREVHLTKDGEVFLTYARQIIEMSDRLKKQFERNDISDSIRIGFTPGLGAPQLHSILSKLKPLHPHLEIYFDILKTESLISKFEAGGLDIIIGAQRHGEKRGEILFNDRLVWIGSPSHVGKLGSSIPLVLQPRPAIQRDIVFDALSASHRRWTVCFESADLTSQRAAVVAGWGISAQPSMVLETAGLDPAISCDLPLPDLGNVEFFIRQRNCKNNLVADYFCNFMKEIAEIWKPTYPRHEGNFAEIDLVHVCNS